MTGRLPYRYRANGLDIASAMELPELHGGDGRPDARIVYGEVPACLDRPTLRGPHAQTRRDECLLTVRNVARYWIRAGREVIVAPDAGADPADVRVFLLSSAMGALAHQNRLLPLHASAADVGGADVIVKVDQPEAFHRDLPGNRRPWIEPPKRPNVVLRAMADGTGMFRRGERGDDVALSAMRVQEQLGARASRLARLQEDEFVLVRDDHVRHASGFIGRL